MERIDKAETSSLLLSTEGRKDALSVRLKCRSNSIDGTTAGLAAGYYQANLIVLPKSLASSFETYCERNPRPCPLLDVTDAGERSTRIALDSDIATDLPWYRVHKGDVMVEKQDIVEEWRNDSVSFLLGCSFTFDAVLVNAGIPVRHEEEKKTVPMFKTSIPTIEFGNFHGPLVVSMRPIPSSFVPQVVMLSKAYPKAHGAPVHIGDPVAIGIEDIMVPDFGEPVTVHPNEVPVFWACGVTSQVAVGNSIAQEWMSHAPGCMFITDLLIDAFD